MKREKKWGQTDTQTDRHTHTQTTPTRGRIIVADGIYSVGDKNEKVVTQLVTCDHNGISDKQLVTCKRHGLTFSNPHLTHVKRSYSADGVGRVNDCGRFPLRLGKNNVDKVLGRRHHRDLLKIVRRSRRRTHL